VEKIETNFVKESNDQPDHLLSRAEASEFGRSLRNKTPRTSHAGWNAVSGRTDPVDILIETSKGREAHLVPIRYGRMLKSPFAFYRGAAAVMAADLAITPSTGVYVQSCGDCHLVNFGSYATPERRIVFDINDFDETLPAPWEWDLKRLAASFVIAAMNNDIGKVKAKEIAVACVESYQEHTHEYALLSPLEVWYSSVSIDDVMKMTKNEETKKRFLRQVEKAKSKSLAGEDYPKLTKVENGKRRIADNPPLIYHRNDVNAEKYHQQVEEAFQRRFDFFRVAIYSYLQTSLNRKASGFPTARLSQLGRNTGKQTI
jgi:hypothetical protein